MHIVCFVMSYLSKKTCIQYQYLSHTILREQINRSNLEKIESSPHKLFIFEKYQNSATNKPRMCERKSSDPQEQFFFSIEVPTQPERRLPTELHQFGMSTRNKARFHTE